MHKNNLHPLARLNRLVGRYGDHGIGWLMIAGIGLAFLVLFTM